jgi:hypothetical protein
MGRESGSRKKESEDTEPAFGLNRFENSVTYRKNPKTGEWEIVNPAASIAYNYLYREDKE